MSKGTTGEADVIRLRQNIQDLLRRRVLEAVQTVLEEELREALGTSRYERSDERLGYRNGHETRRITTGWASRISTSLAGGSSRTAGVRGSFGARSCRATSGARER